MNKNQNQDLSAGMADVEIVGEKPLTWFDISAIGSGEMIFAAAWAWIAYIGSLYGLKWSIIGFGAGAVIILGAWWLYREMISAVPEPGMLQSYGREGGLFSLGSAYFILYVPLYAGFMWIELQTAGAVAGEIFASVPTWVWPLILLTPIMLVNLAGTQITGKLQAVLVAVILLGDLVVGIAIWMAYDAGVIQANWVGGSVEMTFVAFFGLVGMWIGIMAGVLEVQQVMVDEWQEFEKSRDLGLIYGSVQLGVTQIVLGVGVMLVFPLDQLVNMPVPPLGVVESLYGKGMIYAGLLIFLASSTFTTNNVFFMAMGKILALYSMQGALPRIFSNYSSRAVPWFSILVCFVLAIVGAYWTDWGFIVAMLSTWGTTLYLVVGVLYLAMKRNEDLERPVVAKFGVPIAVAMVLVSGMMTVSLFIDNPGAVAAWIGVVVVVMLYDYYVVPRTKRGGHYRAEVLRARTSAARLG